MSDAAVEAAWAVDGSNSWCSCREVIGGEKVVCETHKQIAQVITAYTADLTARLASAEGDLDQALSVIKQWRAENDTLKTERARLLSEFRGYDSNEKFLKAAIEQARYAELERTTALLNEIMPRYREMFEAAGLGDFTQSIVFQIASDALASAAGGRRE